MNIKENTVSEESVMLVAKGPVDEASVSRLEIRRNFLMQSARYMQLDMDTSGFINSLEITRYKH